MVGKRAEYSEVRRAQLPWLIVFQHLAYTSARKCLADGFTFGIQYLPRTVVYNV